MRAPQPVESAERVSELAGGALEPAWKALELALEPALEPAQSSGASSELWSQLRAL